MDEQGENEAQVGAPQGSQLPETEAAPALIEGSADEALSQAIEDILKSSTTEKEKILKLHLLGYDQEELVRLFGFKKATVYTYLPVNPKAKKVDEELKTEDNPALPLILKDGKGEVLSPEAVYHRLVLSDGADGERDFRALMKWAASIEMVQRMTQIMKGQAEAQATAIKPILDIMEKAREDMDAQAAEEGHSRN
ncbi:MAG: hypothetical protein JRJ75_18135 [Deltaproteobacteria bacterium]|nr:hypothetical protein [Deltaproteobacteria bacterium]